MIRQVSKEPAVSVICIARTREELEAKHTQLRSQTFKDFEFVGEAGGTIPEAWNRAIGRARGEILVFTETDASPVSDRWLNELVAAVPDERTLVKGLEVTALPWDLSNLACHRQVFTGVKFDERFRWAEDSELFCRLRDKGYEFEDVRVAPVVHLQKLYSKRLIRRAFRYGMYQARLRHWYRDPVLVAGLDYAGKRLIAALLNLLGLAAGYVIYLPERLMAGRKRGSTQPDLPAWQRRP